MHRFVSRLSAAAEQAVTLAGAVAAVGLWAGRAAEGRAGTAAMAVWQAGPVGLVAGLAVVESMGWAVEVRADPRGGVRKCELLGC